jgi:hypothetical protein
VGDGLVMIAVHPQECLVGSVISVTWERNSDGGFSNLDYLALFEESDASFDAPFAYQFAQPEVCFYLKAKKMYIYFLNY